MLVLGLALACVALYFVTGGRSGSGSSSSSASPTATATTPGEAGGGAPEVAARHFLDTYVKSNGRVARTDQDNDTVGEGQAYGMLLAAAIGDEKRFDLIWGWTKDHLRGEDGLIAFLWKNGKIVDPKPASDADMDAARALLTASCRFDRPGLRNEGIRLSDAILTSETTKVANEPLLVAGPWARTPKVIFNPSYFSPATYAALGNATGDGRWSALAASSQAAVDRLMPDPGDLPPDWAVIKDAKPVASGPPTDLKADPAYGFDAVRTLVRYAEDPSPEGRRLAARAWPAFEGRPPADIPVEWTTSGKPAGKTQHAAALVAAAAAAAAAGETAEKEKLLDAAAGLDRGNPTYYGAAWVALGRMMLDTHALECR
jgi:endo-1,4-beta-D-glucanase Y